MSITHANRDHGTTPGRVTKIMIAAVMAFAGLVVPVALEATPAHAAASARALPADFDSQVLAYTNAERTKRGLRALKPGSCVDAFAARHTATLARQNRMYHQALRPVLRTCHKRTAGENLAWRSPNLSAKQVVQMWMKSPGHRANILNPRFRVLGVDAYQNSRSGRVFAGQVFSG